MYIIDFTGRCSYGDKCKFSHGAESDKIKAEKDDEKQGDSANNRKLNDSQASTSRPNRDRDVRGVCSYTTVDLYLCHLLLTYYSNILQEVEIFIIYYDFIYRDVFGYVLTGTRTILYLNGEFV